MAQYHLANMYLTGEGVAKNVGLAARWLANAAKKQHAASQAVLGDLLWRGKIIGRRPIKGLALLTVAHANAPNDQADWIGKLYRRAMTKAPERYRALAQRLAGQWTGQSFAAAPSVAPAAGAAAPAAEAAAPARVPARPPTALGLQSGSLNRGNQDTGHDAAPAAPAAGFRNVGTTTPTTAR